MPPAATLARALASVLLLCSLALASDVALPPCTLRIHRTPVFADEPVGEELRKRSMDLDFASWRRTRLNSSDFWRAAKKIPESDILKLLAIIDGRLYFPRAISSAAKRGDCTADGPCNPLFWHLNQLLGAALRAGWTVPDVVWLQNVQDWPRCWGLKATLRGGLRMSSCRMPILSFHKMAQHLDVLVPQPLDADTPVVDLPWHCKTPKAVWRGTGFCMQHMRLAKCSRSHLARLSLKHPRVLDVALTKHYGSPDEVAYDPEPFKAGPLPVGSHLPLREHARFKYTLALDGNTASTRLGKLLRLDSAVLKQESPWLEWYYRALQADRHYVPFWRRSRNDVLSVVAALQRNDSFARHVAREGQAFGRRHLSLSAKLAYWKLVLQTLRDVLDDMDGIVAAVKARYLGKVLPRKGP